MIFRSRNRLLALALLAGLGALGGCHARKPPPAAVPLHTLPQVTPPDAGALHGIGAERVNTALRIPQRDRYGALFGSHGLLPYVPPAVQSHEDTPSGGVELEIERWLSTQRSATLLLIGQDTSAGQAVVARFAHVLATAGIGGEPVPVPLPIQLTELTWLRDRNAPISRIDLAAQALERVSGKRPSPEQVRADLEAGALVLMATDFDRAAELAGPAGAQALFDAVSVGPGRMVMTARPVWFSAGSGEEQELAVSEDEETIEAAPGAGTDASSTTDKSRPGQAIKSGNGDVSTMVLEALTTSELNQAAIRLRSAPDLNWEARFAAAPALRTLARHPALTARVLDSMRDPLLVDALSSAPDPWHLFEGWTRSRLETMVGEGQLVAVGQLEAALAHFAGRLYREGRYELLPDAPEEATLREEANTKAVCASDGLLSCTPQGWSFSIGLVQDYFAARALRTPLMGKQAPSASAWTLALGNRRPGAGALAFLASGLDDIAGIDMSIRDVLNARVPPESFVLEALVRLRLLREGVAGADGGIRDAEDQAVDPVVLHVRETQAFWTKTYRDEDEQARSAAAADVSRFLKARAGGRYTRGVAGHLLNDREGGAWAWIPAGRAIVGSYLSRDEDPLRMIEVKTPFLLQLTLTTNEQFLKFVRARKYQPHPPWIKADWARFLAAWPGAQEGRPTAYPEGRADHPVLNVSSIDARAYADWRAAADRTPTELPAEDEWEYAARAHLGRLYPWGDVFNPDNANTTAGDLWQTTPVNRYASRGEGPLGNLDMAGNVWEWTSSSFERSNSAGGAGSRALHGGGWRSAPTDARASRRLRAAPNGRYDVVGIRLKRAAK